MTDATVIQPKFHHFNLKTRRLQEMIDWYTDAASAPASSSRTPRRRMADERRRQPQGRPARFRRASRTTPRRTPAPACITVPSSTSSFEDLNASYLRLREPASARHLHRSRDDFLLLLQGPRRQLCRAADATCFGDWASSSEWMRGERGVPRQPDGHLRRPGHRLRRRPRRERRSPRSTSAPRRGSLARRGAGRDPRGRSSDARDQQSTTARARRPGCWSARRSCRPPRWTRRPSRSAGLLSALDAAVWQRSASGAQSASAPRVALAERAAAAPVPDPEKIICLGPELP